MLIRPVVLNPAPSILVLTLGGFVGGLLGLGLLYGAPVAGWPALDILRALGGVFTSSPDAALGIGALVVLFGTTIVLPLAASAMWMMLPGRGGTIAGTALNGLAVGVLYWLAVGACLGLARLGGDGAAGEPAGLMGFAAGLRGATLFAAAALAYGLSVAFVAFVEQGISPLDAIGWTGFSYAATGPLDLGAHRSDEPVVPGSGEQPWRGR